MNPKKLYPLVLTKKLAETKAYYVERAGFEIVFDMEGYLQVRYGDEDGPELAFMDPDQDTPLGELPHFTGQGLIISVPTDSADDKAEAMKKAGAELRSMPGDKPWGWRSFIAVDPNGVMLDFFHVLPNTSQLNATG